MEVAVGTFEEHTDKMVAAGLEANPEATEVAVEWQEFRERMVVRRCGRFR
jgi:hypothetical protein